MRGLVLTTGALLGGGFVLLGALVLLMGEAVIPARRHDIDAAGLPAYAMGVAWIALGAALFCVSLLGADVGQKYQVRLVRDWSFLAFGLGFVIAVAAAIARAYG
jgi:hypothetical protein